jgi:hypothetical protein
MQFFVDTTSALKSINDKKWVCFDVTICLVGILTEVARFLFSAARGGYPLLKHNLGLVLQL